MVITAVGTHPTTTTTHQTRSCSKTLRFQCLMRSYQHQLPPAQATQHRHKHVFVVRLKTAKRRRLIAKVEREENERRVSHELDREYSANGVEESSQRCIVCNEKISCEFLAEHQRLHVRFFEHRTGEEEEEEEGGRKEEEEGAGSICVSPKTTIFHLRLSYSTRLTTYALHFQHTRFTRIP